jgi:hypothetical protein
MYYSRNMPTPATYFPPAGQDAFGDVLYGAPVAVKVRWQTKNELFTDAQGRQQTSRAVVYVSDLVVEGGRLALGSVTDPDLGDIIRSVGVSPSLDSQKELVKAWT